MKFFCTKFFAVFLFLFLAFNAKAVNDTLTIGQAFDWKVGDSLVYHLYTWQTLPGFPCNPCTTSFSEFGFSVDGRQNFSDTIVYYIKRTNSNADTLVFSQLDTSVLKFSYSLLYPHFGGCQELTIATSCDSPGVQCTINPADYPTPIDSLTSTSISWINFETMGSRSFTQKVGLRNDEWNQLEFPIYPGGCGIKLAYYKSDSTIWLDSTYYFPNSIPEQTSPSPSFRLSPNPATDEITITADGGNQSSFDINVYDIAGKCMLSHKNIFHNMVNLMVNHLPPGYYLLKLTDDHSNSASKGFIIAR